MDMCSGASEEYCIILFETETDVEAGTKRGKNVERRNEETRGSRRRLVYIIEGTRCTRRRLVYQVYSRQGFI